MGKLTPNTEVRWRRIIGEVRGLKNISRGPRNASELANEDVTIFAAIAYIGMNQGGRRIKIFV